MAIDRVRAENRNAAGGARVARGPLAAGQKSGVAQAEAVVREPGQALGVAERHRLERRFAHDFGSVRIHADSRAVHSASLLGARAYSVGNHVVLGDVNGERERLLVHELTHVVQRSDYAFNAIDGVAAREHPAEIEAHRNAVWPEGDGPVRASHVRVPAGLLLRQATDGPVPDLDQAVSTRTPGGRSPEATPEELAQCHQSMSADDVVQGAMNDCYLMASLAALASTPRGRAVLCAGVRPADQHGTYDVRLFERHPTPPAFVERWYRVTVRPSRRGAAWPRAVELAYQELHAGTLIGGPEGGVPLGGAEAAMEELTGRPAERSAVTSGTAADDLWTRIRTALASGNAVVAGTPHAADTPAMHSIGIYGHHNYAVVDLLEADAEQPRRVVLRTPWGERYDQGDRPAGASDNPQFTIDFETFRTTFVQVTTSSAPSSGGLGEVAPAVEAIGLSQHVYDAARQHMTEGHRQEALDAIVDYLASVREIDRSLLVAGSMRYDPSLGDEGEALDAGYFSSGAARPAVVVIGPQAFAGGVQLLYSTVLHEYRHVIQMQAPDYRPEDLRGAADLAGAQGQLSGSDALDAADRATRRRMRSLRGELVNRQEAEAYATEILQAGFTGIARDERAMSDLWLRFLGAWNALGGDGRRALHDLYVRAHTAAEHALGRTLPWDHRRF